MFEDLLFHTAVNRAGRSANVTGFENIIISFIGRLHIGTNGAHAVLSLKMTEAAGRCDVILEETCGCGLYSLTEHTHTHTHTHTLGSKPQAVLDL